MDTTTLRPRQFRMINTRAQQSLGTTYPSQRTAQVASQLRAGFMDAVGQVAFSMSPYVFHRVQFRRITRKTVNMQACLLGQERLDVSTPVDFSAIPNNEYMTPQMTQQLAQERNNLQPCDIVSMKPRVKPHPSAFGRYGQDADGRYLVPPVAMTQDRGLSNGSPCSTNVGNQQKAALVEKPHMGPKSFGLFLYVAKPALSISGFHPHPVATPASQAFGSSSSIPGATISTRLRMCNGSHTALRPVYRSASMSITLWSVRTLLPLSAAFLADRLSVPASGDSDDPSGYAFLIPSSLSPDGFGSSELHCSMKLLLYLPRRGKLLPCAIKPRPGTDATPTVGVYHMVSSQQYSRYPLNVKEQ